MLKKFGELWADPAIIRVFAWGGCNGVVGAYSGVVMLLDSLQQLPINRETYDALVEHFGAATKNPFTDKTMDDVRSTLQDGTVNPPEGDPLPAPLMGSVRAVTAATFDRPGNPLF